MVLACDSEGYEIDLERCITGVEMWRWVDHLQQKRWATAEILGDLVKWFDFVLDTNTMSYQHLTEPLANVREHVEARVANGVRWTRFERDGAKCRPPDLPELTA
jgi:hypothetical protein